MRMDRIPSFLPTLLLILLMSSSFCMPVLAQENEEETYTLVLREVALEQALEQLVFTTKMNLLYDPILISNQTIFCNSRNEVAENILRCITEAAELDFYQLSSGTYVLVERAQEEPQYGDLAGIVVDIETGEPLPYANVFLADASTGTAANSAGMFSFTSLLKGTHAVVATYVGYEPALDSVWIPAEGRIRKSIALKPSPIVADPIIVNGLQQRLPSVDLKAEKLTPENFSRSGFQGTDDVLYNAGASMAVGIRPPYVDLHIQGGESSEHQIQLDGAPVFEPVSLGRLLGAFSPLAIGRLTVHKAGFGAPIGSQLAGIISAQQHIEPKDGDNVTLQLDPVSANGRVSFGFDLPGRAESAFMVAGRTSVWDLYKYNTLDGMLQDWNTIDPQLSATALGVDATALSFTPHRHGSDVSFSDLHAAGRITINPFHKLYFSAYQGKNNIGTELLSAAASNVAEADFILLTRDKYRWTNTTAVLKHEWLLGARAMGVLKLSNSLHTLRHNYNMIDSNAITLPDNIDTAGIEQALTNELNTGDTPDDKNRIRETTLSAQLELSVAKNHHLITGIEATSVSNQFRLDSPFFARLETANDTWRAAGYVHDKIAIGLNTNIEAGTRLTYLPDREKVYFEPRISLRHDVTSSSIGSYALHLAAGVYRQYVNQFDLSSVGPSAAVPSIRFWLPIDETLAPPKAIHYTANFLVVPTEGWSFRIESYYKDQPQILSLKYHSLLVPGIIDAQDSVPESAYIEESDGFAYGGGIFVEKQYRRGLVGLSYSYSEAKRRYPELFDDRLETTAWNEPHRLSLSHEHAFTQQLSTSLRAHGIWGRTWGFRQAYYDYLATHNPDREQYAPYDLTNPSAHKMAPHYQVDFGIAYERMFNDVTIQLRADVLNVLNRKNVVDWSFINPTDASLPLERIERTMPGTMTAISLRAQF
ncbi:MAG: carboxypeptidase-like regulatory domain-containing protein [Bacteroidota bacterium]